MGVQPITIPQSLAYVLNSAGDKSDVDFTYLLQTAQRESALNPTAKARAHRRWACSSSSIRPGCR